MILPTIVQLFVRADDGASQEVYRIEKSTVSGVTIDRGVSAIGDALGPATLSMRLLDPEGKLRDLARLFYFVVVRTDTHDRFKGYISDLSVTYDLDDGWVLDVIAIEQTAALGEPVGKAFPGQPAGNRITDVLLAAGYPYKGRIDTTGTWGVQAVEPSNPGPEAWDLLNAAAKADFGLLSSDRSGTIRYYSHGQLAGTNLIKAVLHGRGVLADSKWSKSLDDFVTRVVVALPQSKGQTYTATDQARQLKTGRRVTLTLDAPYTTDADAKAAADEALKRLSGEEWLTDALTIDLGLDLYNPGRTRDVLKLNPGDLVWVREAPPATPAWGDDAGQVYLVLGWSENIDPGNDSHTFALRVVDYATIRDRAMWGNVVMSWKAAGATAVQDYIFGPPAVDPDVTP